MFLSRLNNGKRENSFESFALKTYGKTIAKLFLLNYSEKLWGLPCSELSPNVAGKRMKGLCFKTFWKEIFDVEKEKTQHLEGSFYYPNYGIGTIMHKLADACGKEKIFTNSIITKVIHNHNRVIAVDINHKERIPVDFLISTIPLSHFLTMLEPSPPDDVLMLANSLCYQDVKLIALFLNKKSIINASSLYFPEQSIPFTRICEPKNRNKYMSPEDRTSVVIEIPYKKGDCFDRMQDNDLIEMVISRIIAMGWIRKEDIIDTCVEEMHEAYPVLEKGIEKKLEKIFDFLKTFYNLRLLGRVGKFVYAHLHDTMRYGKEIIDDYMKQNLD